MVVSSTSRGFSLIELLVVTGILIAITGLMLANHSRFGGKILLENLAYDMALSMREAQVYGISVLRFGASTYTAGYGMHFAVSTPTSYTLFGDAIQVDGLFTAGETVKTYSIDRGYRIEKLCTPAGTDIASCTSVSVLDVIYRRPEPDAWISANGNSCTVSAANCKESARIGLVSPSGDRSDFVVDINGQVSVNR
jgi:hypothetical protein